MRKAFLEFLTNEGTFPVEELDDIRTLLRVAPEPIGAIAFRYGMLSAADIDRILDEQRANRRPFGEIARQMGMLREDQLQTLLSVQRMRAATEVTEALALAGLFPVEEIVPLLGRFLSQASVSAPA